MSRINTNIQSLIGQANLRKNNRTLADALNRLASGVQINSGKDGPAGLIAGEFLRQEITNLNSAIANNNRANNVLSTADSALAEVSNLLNDIQGIITTTANTGVLSDDEITANQNQVDSAITSINRIATSTQFAGKKLLDGSLGFQISGLPSAFSGTSDVTRVVISVANFNAAGDAITVNVTLSTTADVARVTLDNTTVGQDSTFIISGNRGSATVSVGSGQSVIDAINGVTDQTGVQASGSQLLSVDFGSSAFARIQTITGNAILGLEASGNGVDATGTINGQNFSAQGWDATVKMATLEIDLTFARDATAGTLTSFTIEGGGAKFQLGQEINSGQQLNLGLQSVYAVNLGLGAQYNANNVFEDLTLQSIMTGGSNSLLVNRGERIAITAQIVEASTAQIGAMRARIGAVQKNTIETNINSLNSSLENISAARSEVVDTDFAKETANLTRAQILVQASTSTLSIANSLPQSVLSLLGG